MRIFFLFLFSKGKSGYHAKRGKWFWKNTVSGNSMDNEYLKNFFLRVFPDGKVNAATLSKVHFIDILSDRMEISRAEATTVIEVIFGEIEQALLRGQDVKVANFGTFSTRDKSARPGRNPKTGQAHEICARRVITFIPSPHLRDAVAECTKKKDAS